MKKWSRKKKILVSGIFLFLTVQAIQPPKNSGNPNGPTDITKTLAVPDSVFALLKTSCYDCHSNNTNYPWYDHITPVNWWVADHIIEGKRELNFTTFGEYGKNHQAEMLEAIGETVQMNAMPLDSYLWVHSEARLSKEEKGIIFNWTKKAMNEISLGSQSSR